MSENKKVLTAACHLRGDSFNAIISDGPDLGCVATVTFVADRGRFVVRVYLELTLRKRLHRSLDHRSPFLYRRRATPCDAVREPKSGIEAEETRGSGGKSERSVASANRVLCDSER